MVNLKLVAGLLALFAILLAVATLTIYITAVDNEPPRRPCEKWNSEELKNEKINKDGSIISNGFVYKKNEIYKDSNVSRGCKCLKKPCLRKCCPFNQIYELYNDKDGLQVKCVNQSEVDLLSNLTFYEYTPGNKPKESLSRITSLVNEELKSYCLNEKMTLYESNFILTDGSLLIQDGLKKDYELKTINDYCIELMKENIYYFTCLNINNPRFAIQKIKLQIFSSCMLITLPFLIITFLVYFFIPDLHNLVGKSLSSLTFSKIISYSILILMQREGDNIGKLLCVPVGYILQYTFLASFFWLNVMCFDIWLVFRKNRPQRSMAKEVERRRFMKYAIYAWGMPAILCVTIYVADKYLPDSSDYKPMIGLKYCLINTDNKSRLVFYFLPLTILLILNIAMFLTTASKIFLHKKQMAEFKSKGKRISNQKDKERFNLYFKLFLIMGITWITEPISSVFEEKPEWLWILLDASNLLLGIMIFVIFVCKRRTLKSIAAKLCPSKNYFNNCSSTNTGSTTTKTTVSSVSNSCKEKSTNPEENIKTNTTDEIEMESLSKDNKY